MGKKSVKQNKNIYQISREEAELTRDKASELMEFVSSDRIEKIESEKTVPHPDEIMAMAEDTSTNVGTGGMITKLHAAKICSNAHCDMVIASGENPAILYDIVDGKICG